MQNLLFCPIVFINKLFSKTRNSLRSYIDFPTLKDMQLPETGSNTLASDLSIISLQGYMDSPESRAMIEWEEFLEQYNAEHKSPGNIVFVVEGREDWQQYTSVWSYEMGEKLDEITEKYGLKLHTVENIIDSDEQLSKNSTIFYALSVVFLYQTTPSGGGEYKERTR